MDEGPSTNQWINVGWTCTRCGALVSWGTYHACPYASAVSPSQPADLNAAKVDRIIFLLEKIARDLETLRLRK